MMSLSPRFSVDKRLDISMAVGIPDCHSTYGIYHGTSNAACSSQEHSAKLDSIFDVKAV